MDDPFRNLTIAALWARKTPVISNRGFNIYSGDTYSRTFSTTIGLESLTTVFGMGTGGTLPV